MENAAEIAATNEHRAHGIDEIAHGVDVGGEIGCGGHGARYRTQLHRFIGCSELQGWDEVLPTDLLIQAYQKEGKTATDGRYDGRLYETLFFKDEYFNDTVAKRVYDKTYDEWFQGADKPVFRKYMPADAAGLSAAYFAPNIVLMRYANVLLMKAEALSDPSC